MKLVKKAASLCEVFDVSEFVHNVIVDIVYKMVLGCSVDEEFDLKGQLQLGMELSGAFNLADYVPFLGVFDLQRYTLSNCCKAVRLGCKSVSLLD
ncbi:hypothetical protein TSUD_74120 [Trifolium subterraneum]|uniref:Uncharacterized protein n=1 Tax=Trifolium subterraneum TaxID=3900 RepID=A0A2Z6PS08_TRISU|nr:hypothetical protein TSUD_74120 [Trifolium subterraneum]